MKNYLTLLLVLTTTLLFCQHDIKIKFELDTILNILKVDQQIELVELKKGKQDSIILLDLGYFRHLILVLKFHAKLKGAYKFS